MSTGHRKMSSKYDRQGALLRLAAETALCMGERVGAERAPEGTQLAHVLAADHARAPRAAARGAPVRTAATRRAIA